MVFVTVRDDEEFPFFVHPDQMVVVRDDVVYAEQLVTREQNAAVDDADLVFIFIAVHVFSDFAKSAQGVNQRVAFLDLIFANRGLFVCQMPSLMVIRFIWH